MSDDRIEEVTGPLRGVRVLAVTHGMAGALATMVLADYGAEVVLVEHRADGLLRRSGGHSLWNRGKRSVAVDLAEAADRRFVAELAAGADVVVEDHRPGVMAGWGLAPDDLGAVNDALVYCSISAYGQTSTDRDRPGFDAAVAARLGIMNEWGGSRDGPIFLGHPALGYSTAMLAVIGTLACVRSRLRSGRGDHVDVSLRDGALALYPMNWWTEDRESAIDQKSQTGDLRFGYKRLLLRMYECADGRLIQVHTGAAGAFDRAMEVFGLGDEVSKMEGSVQMSSLLTDRDLEIMEQRLPDILRSRPSEEWLHDLWDHQVAALPVGQPGEALDDDQVRHAGIVAALDDPALGPIEVVGPPVLLSATPGAIEAPAPTFDQHGDDVRRHGWRAAGLTTSRAGPVTAATPGPPLAGLRLVDFATFFASPYGARLLSDLGAEVIKVEAIEGDPMRPLPEMFEGANRGKTGTSLNLKHPHAPALIEAVVKGADVVQHNLRPGVAERLGIDAASLRRIEPDLIYHYSPGYGSSGPKSMLQSFAPLLSGYVGLFAIGAGVGNRPHATFGNEDYYNGLLGACACLLAVVHRERTGEGQDVESPQLHSSLFTTSEYYKAGGDYRAVIPRVGAGLYGWSTGYRLYQCLDDWICVTCTEDQQVAALARAVLPPDVLSALGADELRADVPETSALSELLEFHFVERMVAEWAGVLADDGVPVEPVRQGSWLAEASFHDAEMLASGRAIEVRHPERGRVRMLGDLVHPVRQPTGRKGRAHLLGEHTADVLAAAGSTPAAIEQLARDGALRTAAT